MRSCVCARNSKSSPTGDRFPSHLQQRFLCSHLCARYWSGTWMRSPPFCATQNEVREIYSGQCGHDRSTKDRLKGKHCRSNNPFAGRLADARSLTRKNHTNAEATSSLRVRKPSTISWRTPVLCIARLRRDMVLGPFKIKESKQTVSKLSSPISSGICRRSR